MIINIMFNTILKFAHYLNSGTNLSKSEQEIELR